MKPRKGSTTPSPVPLNLLGALDACTIHTRRAYLRWISRFLSDQLPTQHLDLSAVTLEPLLGVLDKATVSAWLGALKTNGLGKQSLHQARAALVWLAAQVSIQWPDRPLDVVVLRLQQIVVPRAEEGQRPGTWLTRPQIRALLKAVKIVHKTNPALAARDRAMLLLLVLCGLRREELVSTTWADCFQQGEHPVLRVHGKGQKLRLVKLPTEVVTSLRHWQTIQAAAGEATFIFTGVLKNGQPTLQPITTQTVMERLQFLAEKAGLPKITPHDMRRTFARNAFEAGASLEAIRQTLGHANISTTEAYVKATLELDHAATDVFAEALRSRQRVSDTLLVRQRDMTMLPELLTRGQAAEYLGISMAQFDTLKKRAGIEAVTSDDDHPVTNARTRPYCLYRREDVNRLVADADRLRQKVKHL